MPIVPDLASLSPTVDKKRATPNRSNAGSPYGVLTPEYSGEMVLDSSSGQLWMASGGLGVNNWIPVTKVL